MANMTLSIPNEVYNEMKLFSDIRWSEVARKAIIEKLETLRFAESIVKKSKLTQQDIDQFSKKLKSSALKRFLE